VNAMNTIVVDSSSVITIAMNNLLWILTELKNRFNVQFCICAEVKSELVDVPLATKRFKFDAIQVMQAIRDKTLNIVDLREVRDFSGRLLDLANHSFKSKGSWITIVHRGEIESLATALLMKASAFVVDERTTRLMIESPESLRNLLQSKLHTRIEMNRENIRKFKYDTRDVKILRSVELVLIAYEKGFLNKYIIEGMNDNPKNILIEGLLWGLKLKGCAISEEEILQIIALESRKEPSASEQ
jgi:predicted nucleic acid-binding protein